MIGNILLILNIIGTLIQACPSGWTAHEERCYFFSVVVGSWVDDGSYCRNFNGKLAEPRELSDMIFLDGVVKDKHVPQGEYYLGGADFFVEGEWEWASSFDRIVNSHWAHGEPNDHNGGEDCLALRLTGFWNYVRCNNSLPFVCEIEKDYSQGTIG